MPDAYLGLDLGTGSVKALLMDGGGRVLGEGTASYGIGSPRPGWAESDPAEWWRSCAAAVRRAVDGHEGEVGGIGLSGQMHGVVLSDSGGQPLRPAVLWADTRSREQLDAYRALDGRLLHALANPPAVGMAGPTLLWLRDGEPEVYEAAALALQPKDWVRLRLTGEARSEPSDASATLLYDLGADRWSDAVVEALGLRRDLLAPLVPSGAVAGGLAPEAAKALGLPAGLSVAAGAADAAAAALGSGLLGPGPVQLTVGTGGQILAPRRDPVADPHGRTHLYRAAHDEPSGRYYAMAAVQNAGLALRWALRLLRVNSWNLAYREAFSAPPGSDGVLFLPYLSGERTPHFDPDARGAWIGLGLSHERAHLLRAALEGVAYSLREALEALEATGVQAPELRLAGGGTLREPWRQMLADVLGRPLLLLPRSAAASASARGAALLAGIAAGAFASAADTESLAPEPEGVVEPGNVEVYEEPYGRYRELYGRLLG
jgi:xylulokinase